MRMRFVILGVCFAMACATTKSADQGPPAETVEDFYPLVIGNAWAHSVVSHDTDESILVTSRIAKVDPDGFVLTFGANNVSYARKPEGIFKPQSGYFILKNPIKTGASWKMRDTEGEVRIDMTAQTTTVTAGKFKNCIHVTEEIPGSQKVEWVYAPGVGPIRMRVYSLEIDPPLLLISSELKGYQVKLAPRPTVMKDSQK
jgi:hypothetical protein